MTEFRLSDKIFNSNPTYSFISDNSLIEVKDVKEFVRKLKEKLSIDTAHYKQIIDNLTGDELK